MGFRASKGQKGRGRRGGHEGGDTFWTSNSDLFLMMSAVFLMLYVVSSLKSQTASVQKNAEYQAIAQKAADLEQQIKVYNTLRDQHLKEDASAQEQQVYNKLMGKLDLLQEEAKSEKEALRRKAQENEDKEYALNEYQRLIRNIINTNMLAKTQIKNRDQNIKEQKQVIADQDVEIDQLQEDVAAKQKALAINKQKITEINEELNEKIEELSDQQKRSQMTKVQLNNQIAKLRSQSLNEIKALESKNQDVLKELNEAQANLTDAERTLASEQQRAKQEKSQLVSKLNQTRQGYEAEMAKLREEHNDRMAAEKKAFDDALGKERLSAMEKAKRLKEFAAQAKAKERELSDRLGDLNNKVRDAEGRIKSSESALAKAADEKGRFVANIEGLKKEREQLSGDLKRATELANARRNLAKRIRGELDKQGLAGFVDQQTGDVTLAFGEEYFDTGSADLKGNMRNILQKFMPGYSKSLFSDEQIAKNIDNVEIIGFASSTYKGRYVPPDSLKPEDQAAINYNLKLSFDRANSIFKHVFDTNKMKFEHQRQLLPKIKVVGRGYLPDGKSGQDFAAGLPEGEFCKRYNCKQAQKVIIKFKLKD